MNETLIMYKRHLHNIAETMDDVNEHGEITDEQRWFIEDEIRELFKLTDNLERN